MAGDERYIKFTPISGANSEGPLCYLLEIEHVKILLDCGWTDEFDVRDLEELSRVAKEIDVVLISHSDVAHFGAYAYAYKYLGLQCPAYATTPTINMGRLCMYDLCKAKTRDTNFTVFTWQDIDEAFHHCTELHFQQSEALKEKCSGITVTPYEAAHTLGGSIWNITQDTDNIVYAVDFNHREELHLNKSVLSNPEPPSSLMRPSIFITSALNAEVRPQVRKELEIMFDTIKNSLRQGSSVLLPTDSAARILETAYQLDQHWINQGVSYPLVMLTHTSGPTVKYAKSYLEFMNAKLTEKFRTRTSGYEFEAVRLCKSIEEVDALPDPKVVVASSDSLNTGFGHELFLRWMTSAAGTQRNTLILTERAPPRSLSRQLYEAWQAGTGQQRNAIEYSSQMQLSVTQTTPLEGDELKQFEERQKERVRQKAAEVAAAAAARAALEAELNAKMDSDDSDIEDAENAMEGVETDRYVRGAGSVRGLFGQDKSFPMFPHVERRKRVGDYGEEVQAKHFMSESDRKGHSGYREQNREDLRSEDELHKLFREKELPIKRTQTEQDVQVQCILRFIDLQAECDGFSIANILSKIAPRKLIIVRGSKASTDYLVRQCRAVEQLTKDVFTPSVGDVVNVSATTNVYRVRLTDGLMAALGFSGWESYKLARLSGRVHFSKDDKLPLLDVDTVGVASKWEPSVFVGDVSLTEFKNILQQKGIMAEFKGEGTLVCNGQVAVRKTGTGQLLIEGRASLDYYKIRSLLYSEHAVL